MPLISTKSSASAQGLGFTAQSGPRTTPISGYELWLDSSDASTFTYSSGTVVSRWTDKSINAYAFEPSSTTYAPSRSGTQNSKSTVVFDGTDDFITCTSAASAWKFLHDGTQATVLVVYKDTESSSTSSSSSALLNTNNYEFASVTAGYPGYSLEVDSRYLSGGGFWAVEANTDVNSGVVQSGQTYPAYVWNSSYLDSANHNTWNVHISLLDVTAATTNQKITTYNSQATNPNTASTSFISNAWVSPSSSNPGTALRIGRERTASYNPPFKGEIAEIIIYKRKLSVSEKSEMMTYLKNKWSV